MPENWLLIWLVVAVFKPPKLQTISPSSKDAGKKEQVLQRRQNQKQRVDEDKARTLESKDANICMHYEKNESCEGQTLKIASWQCNFTDFEIDQKAESADAASMPESQRPPYSSFSVRSIRTVTCCCTTRSSKRLPCQRSRMTRANRERRWMESSTADMRFCKISKRPSTAKNQCGPCTRMTRTKPRSVPSLRHHLVPFFPHKSQGPVVLQAAASRIGRTDSPSDHTGTMASQTSCGGRTDSSLS